MDYDLLKGRGLVRTIIEEDMTKILELFTSLRFWIVTLAAVSFLLGQKEVGTLTPEVFFTTISTWLGTIVAIRTVDKFSQ
jgi:hypothetical protein